MADVAVAVYTVEHLAAIAGVWVDLVENLAVASDAVLLQHRGVARLDHDRFGKVLEREPLGVPEAVFRFGRIFCDEAVWGVAVIARGDRVMAGVLPAIVLLAHDVTVHTSGGIVGEIGMALTIVERVAADSGEQTDRRSQNQCGDMQ